MACCAPLGRSKPVPIGFHVRSSRQPPESSKGVDHPLRPLHHYCEAVGSSHFADSNRSQDVVQMDERLAMRNSATGSSWENQVPSCHPS